MEINAKSADRKLLLELSGEIDHHGARDALRELERWTRRCPPGWCWI